MSTEYVDYTSRREMIAALLDYRRDPAVEAVDIVNAGRTLRLTLADGSESPSGAPEGDEADPTPPPAPDEAPEGVQSPPEPEDDEGDDSGLAAVADYVNSATVEGVREAIDAGLFTAEQAVEAEKAGQQRKGILSLVSD